MNKLDTLMKEIFAGINFREFFSDISRELIFGKWALPRIWRELIFCAGINFVFV